MFKIIFTFIFSFVSFQSLFGIEKPEFKLIQKKDNFEVRDYKDYLIAEVMLKGSYKDVQNEGFKKLAAYIFGENSKKQKMDMTAPVQLIQEGIKIEENTIKNSNLNSYLIQFVMPSKFTLDTLPSPKDAQVHIKLKLAHKMAVIVFKGNPNEELVRQKTEELLGFIKKEGLKPLALSPILARYNPPFVPGFLKHNEVLIEIY